MKKTVFLLICISSLTILLGSSNVMNQGIPLKQFSPNTPFKQALPKNLNPILDDIILLPIEPFHEKEATSIITRIGMLPDSLLKKIQRAHIHVKLFNGKLTDNPTAMHLKGVIPKGYKSKKTWNDVPGIGGGKTVLVKIGASEKGKGHGSVNLELHELAHSIDRHVYKTIRDRPDFLNIWEEEKESLFPNDSYFQTYPEEYFAECFAMFYLNISTKSALKNKAPKTYRFMKNLK